MTRNQIKADMDRLGQWQRFVAYRTEAASTGLVPKDARLVAYQRIMQDLGQTEQPPEPADEPENPEKTEKPAKKKKARGGDTPGQHTPPVAPKDAAPASFNPFGKLISKAEVKRVFGSKKKPSQNTEDEWVEDNIDVAVELDDAPSIAAWSRLMRLRISPDLMRDFFRGRMQVKSLRQEAESKKDDGKTTNDELIDRCMFALTHRSNRDSVLSSGAEGVGGEPEVPEED